MAASTAPPGLEAFCATEFPRAPHPAAMMEIALVGTMLQLEGVTEVQLLVDGSCEAYEARMEGPSGGPCLVLDETHAPWAD